jgi:pimeloyl-ACP methyl ester carboxylesterase
MTNQIQMPDGRTVGFAEFGAPDGTAVLWCHGGPGSRLEPKAGDNGAREASLRLIGIDRPGYGLSTARPGRTIADSVPDGLAVVDHLGIDRFVAVGVSTGGAYALALGSMAPERVTGVVACCALTDMRWEEGKAMLAGPGTDDIWRAKDREEAMGFAAEVFGADGSKMGQPVEGGPAFAAADLAMLTDPVWGAAWQQGVSAMFAQGVVGYTDDRLADGLGWGTFDVSAVRCPVAVIHGAEDTIVPVAHAHHTAEMVPGAKLRVFEHEGHLSIIRHVLPEVLALRG